MVFLSGITLAILPKDDRKALFKLLLELKAEGIEIAFDSNFRPALWPDDDNFTVKAVYDEMYKLTDLALVTFDDEQLLWEDNSAEKTLARLACMGVQKIVVKLGADGCLVQDYSQGLTPQMIPTKVVKHVVDTTSAGDSFNGGFLSSYLAGGDIKHACQRGNTLAGVVIQHRGAIISKEFTQPAIKAV
jgi:2-dehydro-3-deoxygluconokinase